MTDHNTNNLPTAADVFHVVALFLSLLCALFLIWAAILNGPAGAALGLLATVLVVWFVGAVALHAANAPHNWF